VGEQMFTMKNKVAGRKSVVIDDFVQSVDERIYEKWSFRISELFCEFPLFHAFFGFALTFFRVIPQRWQ
jgi:hypothetical protein